MVFANDVTHQLRNSDPTDWVSDSSMSKLVSGRFDRADLSKNGLRLTLDTGKTVNWRMPERVAKYVLEDLYGPEPLPFTEAQWAHVKQLVLS